MLNLQIGVSAPLDQEGVPFTYGVDKVSIVPVPEPSTGALIAVGLLALGRARRRC